MLWSPKPGVVDAAGNVLKKSDLRFVAIADPKTAPYGAAAEKVLEALHVLAPLRAANKLTIGESIGQTLSVRCHVATRTAAFVALSQVIAEDGTIPGSSWIIPPTLYGKLDQDAVVLKASTKQKVAQLFLNWLHTDPAALKVIRAAGYLVASHPSGAAQE